MSDSDTYSVMISTRERFDASSPQWQEYLDFIEVPNLTEIRTIDMTLNPCVDDCGSIECEVDQIGDLLSMLPTPKSEREYVLLIKDALINKELPSQWHFLGFDLAPDKTFTSSLSNCGAWKGRLEPLTKRLNAYGLLTLQDALKAREVLPREWGADEPQAVVSIWALYELRSGPAQEKE